MMKRNSVVDVQESELEEGEFVPDYVYASGVGVGVGGEMELEEGEIYEPTVNVSDVHEQSEVEEGEILNPDAEMWGVMEDGEMEVDFDSYFEGCGVYAASVSAEVGKTGVKLEVEDAIERPELGEVGSFAEWEFGKTDGGEYQIENTLKFGGEGFSRSANELHSAAIFPEFVEQLGCSFFSEAFECLVPTESPHSPEPLLIEPSRLPDLNQMEAPHPLNMLEPMDATYAAQPSEMVENLNVGELLDFAENVGGCVSEDILNSVPQREEKETPGRAALHFSECSVLPENLFQQKNSEKCQASCSLGTFKGSDSQRYRERRISAHRNFPAGCERDTSLDISEKSQKSVEHSKYRSAGIEKSNGENRIKIIVTANAKQSRKEAQNEDAFKEKLRFKNKGSDSERYQERSISANRNFSAGCHERDTPLDVIERSQKLVGKISKSVEHSIYRSAGIEKSNGKDSVNTIVKAKAKQSKEEAQDEDAIKEKMKFKDKEGKIVLHHVHARKYFDSMMKQEGTNSFRSSLGNILSHSDLNPRSFSKMVNSGIKTSFGESGAKSVKIENAMSMTRKDAGQSINERHVRNQLLADNYVCLGPSNKRVTGRAHMAGSNCSRGKEKQSFEHPTKLTLPTTKSIAKKHEMVLFNTCKPISRKRNAQQDCFPGHDERDDTGLVKGSVQMDLRLTTVGANTLGDRVDGIQGSDSRNEVRNALRLFQRLCRKLMRDEEQKSHKAAGSVRVDLASAKILRENRQFVHCGKKLVGDIPGVEVGDEFRYRVELAIVGLHSPYQGGIDSMVIGGKRHAISVVSSGGYEDYMKSSDVLVYSGQGGTPIPGSKTKVPTDQKLEQGNLALKISMDERTPVRVIRGFKGTLTYDGLYFVEKYWTQVSSYGNKIFMFQLRRKAGQPELAIKELKKSNKPSPRPGICVKDISHGKEKMPIGVVNTIDNDEPPTLIYVPKMIHPSHFNPTPRQGCQCIDGCLSSMKCSCAIKNGGQIPFNYDGAIVESKPLIFECGPKCKCPPSCYNRISQHGIKFPLEVFKTKSKGWGVRCLTSIPSGGFVCEYTGELLQENDAEQRIGNDEYLFDIGRDYNDHALWEGISNLIPSNIKSSSCCETVEEAGFTIDAAKYGNVARFINHSCSPNLYAQNVLYDHDDKRMPHIMLFAAENIPPLKELTYHYHMAVDQVRDCDGNVKKKKCYCGSSQCTGRLY